MLRLVSYVTLKKSTALQKSAGSTSNSTARPRRGLHNPRGPLQGDRRMKLVETINAELLKDATLVADSNEFAIYAMGSDTYALVHRHQAVDWQAITISGDGLFRVAELLTKATRYLYRDVAGDLSRKPKG